MKIYQLSCPYVIYEFKDHFKFRDELLALIELEDGQPIVGKDAISKTDWTLPCITSRKYLEFIVPKLHPYMKEIYDKLDHDEFEYQNFWFQQYKTTDKHTWHQHRGASWANVYFVELPEDGPKTTIIDPYTKAEITIDVKEGDILTFPAIAWHCSPPNTSDKRKTVIAFNVE